MTIEIIENELKDEMIELIEYHLPGKSTDTVNVYKHFNHQSILYYDEDGKLDAMLSYFYFDFPYDSIVSMQRDNKFNKHMWRVLKDTIASRVKPLRIMSDPNNSVLVKGAIRHGGVWHQDEIWFY
jgi:hypothetical protein